MCFTSCADDPTMVTAISLSLSKLSNPEIGEKDTIVATLTPSEGAANPNVVWTNSNDSVAQVKIAGDTAFVVILKHGNDTICCSAAEGNGVKSFCYIAYEEDVVDTTEVDSIESDTIE